MFTNLSGKNKLSASQKEKLKKSYGDGTFLAKSFDKSNKSSQRPATAKASLKM
jgi:hypothetical protein